MSTLLDKFNGLEGALNLELFERGKEIHAAINAVVSRRHFFMIGPPGTGKSFLIRRLNDHIDHGEGEEEAYFQWLLTKHSQPEEIFGPPSLAELQQGRYVRDTRRKLPRARMVFLDEIWKANSAILNSLLTAVNERLFFNGDDTEIIPLDSVFGASNEMPEDDSLSALWDRLHFRFEVGPLSEGGSFINMLERSQLRSKIPEKILSYEEVQEAQRQAAEIVVDRDALETLKSLRDNLAAQGVEPTERRFVDSLNIIRAEAWLNGRDKVEMDDLRVLRHVMWSRLEDQRTVERVVLDLSNPIDAEAHELLERVDNLDVELSRIIREGDNEKAIAKSAVEVHGKMRKVKSKMEDIKKRAADADRDSDVLEDLERRFKQVGTRLMREGFNVEPD